MVYLQAVRGES